MKKVISLLTLALNCFQLLSSLKLFSLIKVNALLLSFLESKFKDILTYIKPDIISVADITSEKLANKVKVIVNGCWVGVTDNPQEFYLSLKEKKYKGIINIYTSIVFDVMNMEIRVCNDAGRLCRPVLRVINNEILFNEETITGLSNNTIKWNK